MSEPLHELARRVEVARESRSAVVTALRGCGCDPVCAACDEQLVAGNAALVRALAALDRALAERDRVVLPPAPTARSGAGGVPQQRSVLSDRS